MGGCYVCGKPGHYAAQCRKRKDGNYNPPKANLVEGDVIAAVISQVNMVAEKKEWVIDSGSTRHICGNRVAFLDYVPVREGEEHVLVGDSRPIPVMGEGKGLLKLTSRKTLSLNNVFRVPEIRCNLISISLLG